MDQGVLFVRETISTKEAIEILKNTPISKCTQVPPQKPKAGQVFLFKATEDTKQG